MVIASTMLIGEFWYKVFYCVTGFLYEFWLVQLIVFV